MAGVESGLADIRFHYLPKFVGALCLVRLHMICITETIDPPLPYCPSDQPNYITIFVHKTEIDNK